MQLNQTSIEISRKVSILTTGGQQNIKIGTYAVNTEIVY